MSALYHSLPEGANKAGIIRTLFTYRPLFPWVSHGDTLKRMRDHFFRSADTFQLFFLAFHDTINLPHEFHTDYLTRWECVFTSGKNALSNLTFPRVKVEIRVAAKRSCVFRAQLRLRLRTFLFL